MDERIHRALDGEGPERLTPAEARTVETAEAGIRAVLDSVPRRPLPDLAPVVMARIAELEAERRAPAPGRWRLAPFLARLWQPRPVTVAWRPAYGLAAAAVIALALFTTRGTVPSAPPLPAAVFTQFVLSAPDAQQVYLAGDFTGWQPVHRMTRTEPGVWTIVVPLDPGVHEYAFVVDGEQWIPDPNAPAFDDGFGGWNSRLAVLAPDAEAL